ncbi:MAG: RloB domain-containing protein [Acidimicrobiaceae bacterium]|nr:RloB domain-containing protein [Acidimicrobiaceae bacterium]MXW75660.1 RloB domain-containing protein [Acidimicrobiaceae bacterium]MYA73489.1 RloB domain-containing protein [Acidimicrobiaceae bacterium]MYC42881.1 RloB domain-containing protein [Acidimicrobiaceae bacterium]MYD07256.1 RloB domain-containing protein [Acidimicrobiaceae bacterium]
MAKRRGRSPRKDKPLGRSSGHLTPKRTFLVFCEGKRTEPDYLKALKRESAVRDIAAVEIKVDDIQGVPLTLVGAAVEARALAQNSEVDEVWCLFDVEWPNNHPDLEQARNLAGDKNVHVAISNPCFELWLALHFQDQTAWLNNDQADQLLRRHDNSEGKGLDGTTYMPHRAEASRRARALDHKHSKDGTHFPHDNPSSGMYMFLESINQSPKDQR